MLIPFSRCNSRILLPLLAICLLASLCTGQLALLHDHLPSHPDLRVDGRWIPVQELADAGHEAWSLFEKHMGPDWIAGFSARTHSPIWIFGPGVTVANRLTDDDRTAEIARGWLERLAKPLGVSRPADMHLNNLNATRNSEGGTVVGVDFEEHYKGFVVKNHEGPRLVRMRFHGELGKLFVLGSVVTPELELDVTGALSRVVTFDDALERMAELHSFGPLDHYERYILVLDKNARLVDEHHFLAENPPHRWVFIHDALTGELVEARDDLCHDTLTGNVSGGVLLNGGGSWGSFQVMPLRDLQVTVSGIGSTYTDSLGNFAMNTPDKNPRTVSGRCYGRYANVVNLAGSNISFAQQGTPGTPVNIVMNPSNSQYTTAQTTAYYHVSEGHNFVSKYYGPMSSYLNVFTTNVNYANYCNAFFNGKSINFMRAGGGCNNTAFAEIILHEWGHAFHTSFHGQPSPIDFSEGIADHVALYWTGQRIMGRGFTTGNTVVRDYRPGKSSCCTRYPSSSPDPHKRGEAWAGTAMDMRDNLIAKHGSAKGIAIAETDTISMYRRNPANMPGGVWETFVQDDNDANLLNGTPNFYVLASAADAHGFGPYRPPNPVIIDMDITHTPITGTLTDIVNPLVITAKVEGKNGRTVQKVVAIYDEGSGPRVRIMPMVAKDTYTLIFPPRAPETYFEYTIRATNDLNLTKEVGPYSSRVGRLDKILLNEDFENGWNGWTHVKSLKEDDWMLGKPNQAVINPFDPNKAFSGTNVVGNDLGPLGWDGNYSSDVTNYLSSPAINAAGLNSVWLRYRRWLTYKKDDECWIEASFHRVWTAPTQDFQDKSWVEHLVRISPWSNSPSCQLRFVLQSDRAYEAGGWNIDNVQVESLGNDLVALRTSNATPPVNTGFNFEIETLGGSGYPVSLVASALTAKYRVPNVQDPVLLAPPFVPIVTSATGPNGKFKVPFMLPGPLKGIPIHFQVVAASKRSGNILSNLLTVTAQ